MGQRWPISVYLVFHSCWGLQPCWPKVSITKNYTSTLTFQQEEITYWTLFTQTFKGTYKAAPLPHLSLSEHITIVLKPAYRPCATVQKLVRVLPEGATSALQKRFAPLTAMFRQAATYNQHTDKQENIRKTLYCLFVQLVIILSISDLLDTFANNRFTHFSE